MRIAFSILVFLLIILGSFSLKASDDLTKEQEAFLEKAHDDHIKAQQPLLEQSVENAYKLFVDFANFLLKNNPDNENAQRMKRVWEELWKQKEEGDIKLLSKKDMGILGFNQKVIATAYPWLFTDWIEFVDNSFFPITAPLQLTSEDFWVQIGVFYHEGVHINEGIIEAFRNEKYATGYTIEFLTEVLNDLENPKSYFKKFNLIDRDIETMKKTICKHLAFQKGYQLLDEGTFGDWLGAAKEEMESGQHELKESFLKKVDDRFSDVHSLKVKKMLVKEKIRGKEYTIFVLEYATHEFYIYIDENDKIKIEL